MAESKQSSSASGKKRSGGSGGSRSSSSSKSGGSKSSSSSKSGSNKSGGSGGSTGSGTSQSADGRRKGPAKAREIVAAAAEQLQELIGRPVEGVLAVEKDGSEWAVSVEVLELERVPNTTDVLGRYDVTLDGDGDVVSARRTRRYLRSQSGED